MAQINIRIDDNLKNEAEILLNDMGLNMSTAVNMFIKQIVKKRSIPFEITAKIDPFWNEFNQAHLKRAIADLNAGRGVEHELIEVNDDA